MKKSIQILIVCFTVSSIFATSDIYWRDWNGTVPSDAFVAATDIRGDSYVVQAYLPKYGLRVGQIQVGQTEIAVNPATGIGISRSSVLKVLCTSNNTFEWITSSLTDNQNLLRYVTPVIGGFTLDNKPNYIGKYETSNDISIGCVHTDNWMYFVDPTSGSGNVSAFYQILIREK